MQFDFTSLRDVPSGALIETHIYSLHCEQCGVTHMQPVFSGYATDRWKVGDDGRRYRLFEFENGNPWCWCVKTGIWSSDDGYPVHNWPIRAKQEIEKES